MLLQPSADDARAVRDLMAPLTERDLLNLPRFRMAVRTELEGEARVLTCDVLPEPPAARLARPSCAAQRCPRTPSRASHDGCHPGVAVRNALPTAVRNT